MIERVPAIAPMVAAAHRRIEHLGAAGSRTDGQGATSAGRD